MRLLYEAKGVTDLDCAAMMSKNIPPESQWATLCVVTTTVADAAQADDLARSLVAAKVAACVQSESITSYY